MWSRSHIVLDNAPSVAKVASMGMCQIRTEKHKVTALSHVSRHLAKHHDRSQRVSNADESRAHLNIYEGARSGELEAAWQQQMNARYKMKRALKDDAIGIIEAVCTFSPEDKGRISPEDWHRECRRFIGERFGGDENILMATTHLDESTPHFHAFIIPITERGGLSAREMIGGSRQVASQLQDQFHQSVGVKFGLERGEKRSKAQHEPPAKWRKREEAASAKRVEAERQAREAAAERERAERDRAEAIKAETARLRGLELHRIMQELGYEIKRREAQELIYETEKGHVSINPDKNAYSIDWGKGGRSAFDLVSELTGMNFQDSRAFLAGLDPEAFANQEAQEAAQKAREAARKVKPMDHPELVERFAKEAPERYDEARDYLVEVRGLDPEIVQRAEFYCTEKGGIAFPHLAGDDWTGTTIRGIYSDFKQTLGDKTGAFFIVPGNDSDGIGVVESPIDALSYRELTGRAAISVAGSSVPEAVLDSTHKLRLALDNDEAGERGCKAAQRLRPDSVREKPPANCKDWNQALLQLKERIRNGIRRTIVTIRKSAGSRREGRRMAEDRKRQVDAGISY